MIQFITSIIIAFICGALGARIAGRSSSFFSSVLIGFIGSYIGQYLAQATKITLPLTYTINGQTVHFLWNIIGAMVLVALQNLIFGPSKKNK